MKRRLAIFGVQVLTVAVLVVVWQELVQYQVVSPYLVAPPSDVFSNFWTVLGSHYGPINVEGFFLQSLGLIGIASIVTIPLGLLIGLVIGGVPVIRRVLEEYVVALFSLPKVVVLPLFWVLFGITLTYRVTFAILEAIFPVVLIVMYATIGVDQSLLKMAKASGASRLQRAFKIYLPSIVPSLMGAIRIAFQNVFIGIIIAELFVGNSGIGFMIRQFSDLLEPTELYVVVVAVVLFSMGVNIVLLLLERRLIRWRPPTRM